MANIMVLAAHPDDAEFFAGGLLTRHCRLGNSVRIISVTDGRCGHQSLDPNQLVAVRRAEAQAAGEQLAVYLTWDFPALGWSLVFLYRSNHPRIERSLLHWW